MEGLYEFYKLNPVFYGTCAGRTRGFWWVQKNAQAIRNRNYIENRYVSFDLELYMHAGNRKKGSPCRRHIRSGSEAMEDHVVKRGNDDRISGTGTRISGRAKGSREVTSLGILDILNFQL